MLHEEADEEANAELADHVEAISALWQFVKLLAPENMRYMLVTLDTSQLLRSEVKLLAR